MGLFDFLKKKEIIEPEKVKLKDISSWIKEKEREIEDKSIESSKMIKERIIILTNELEKEIIVLEKVNLKKAEAEERVKLLVKQNLNTYTNYLKKLSNDLKELDEPNLMENITSLFANFEKKSSPNLQKANFLVGKELHAVKVSIGNFFKYLKKNMDEDVLKTPKILSSVKLKLKNMDENNKIKQEITNKLKELKTRKKDLEIQYKATEDKIKRILTSKEYIEEQKRKEEQKKEHERLEKTISSIKKLIDFKALANIFHSNLKNMEIIKSHRENFKDSFQSDRGESILYLLEEANLNNQAIKDKVKEINSIKINNKTITKDSVKGLESTLKGMKADLENLEKEKIKELKREDNLKAPEKALLNQIKKELTEINVILS